MIMLALGGNLLHPRWGCTRRIFACAVPNIAACGRIRACSRLFRSQPWPRLAPEGARLRPAPSYLNAVIWLETRLSAQELLAALQGIEKSYARRRFHPQAPRTLDLDLLDYHGQIQEQPRLTLPHPRLHLRDFVLRPLAEIAPHWRHPKLKASAAQLLACCSPPQAVPFYLAPKGIRATSALPKMKRPLK